MKKAADAVSAAQIHKVCACADGVQRQPPRDVRTGTFDVSGIALRKLRQSDRSYSASPARFPHRRTSFGIGTFHNTRALCGRGRCATHYGMHLYLHAFLYNATLFHSVCQREECNKNPQKYDTFWPRFLSEREESVKIPLKYKRKKSSYRWQRMEQTVQSGWKNYNIFVKNPVDDGKNGVL